MKKIIALLLCCVCLCACTEDPVFEKEELELTATEYIDNVSYYSADVYCQIEANVSINEVILQYYTTHDWNRAQEIEMAPSTSYPELAEFTKNLKVYHSHIADLKEDTTYYCRILTVTPGGKIVVKDSLQFTTLSLLASSVSTREATNVSYTSATLNGEVAIAENVSVTQTGFYYSLNADMSSAEKVQVGSNAGVFSKFISNLEHDKTYHFQAYAVINGKMCKGDILNFITDEYTLAEVETGAVTDITYTSANCSIKIIDTGNSTITEKGIIYGTSDNLKEDKNALKSIISSSSNYAQLKNLTEDTKYYYCAYAINSGGTAFGKIEHFYTKSVSDLDLSITNISSISYTSAKVSFTISTHGQDVREYGLIYQAEDESSTLKKSTTVSNWKNSDKTVSSSYSLSGLKVGTSYACYLYVKYIDSSEDEITQESDMKWFETLNYDIPSVTTGDATNIYTNTAKISMSASSSGTSITSKGFYISSNSNAMYYTDDDDYERYTNIWTKKTSSSNSLTLSNLEENTTYYYVAFAANSVGANYGEVMNFTTKRLSIPEVSATHEERTSYIVFEGHTDGGGENKVTVGIVYYKLSDLTNFSDPLQPPLSAGTKAVYSTSFTPNESNNGDFTKIVYKSGLEKGVMYTFFVYCTNSLGTSMQYIVGLPIN